MTLDANELFQNVQQLEELVATLRATPQLGTFLKNVLAIEQPLARQIALAPNHADAIRRLSDWRPVIIDESDGTLDGYARAKQVGYRGVTSKSCKGPVKSLLNAGLIWLANRRGQSHDYLMTGEDLGCLGVVPVQADLALVATLGLAQRRTQRASLLPGTELSARSRAWAALAAHADLYHEQHGRIAPWIYQVRMEIPRSIALVSVLRPCRIFGPSTGRWRFESLGLVG